MLAGCSDGVALFVLSLHYLATMDFRASFCSPFAPDITELTLSDIPAIISFFEHIPWTELLKQMAEADQAKIYYSPSFEVENKINKNSISISVVGEPDKHEFYLFYKRPKIVKRFLGLSESLVEDYITEIHSQRYQDAADSLHALLSNNLAYLAIKIGA
jgi:hypothetical protein